jgi:hypothetical protein
MREVTPDFVMHRLLRLMDEKTRGILEPWNVIGAPATIALANAAQI